MADSWVSEGLSAFSSALTPFLSTWSAAQVRAFGNPELGRLLALVACFVPPHLDDEPPEVSRPVRDWVSIRTRISADALLGGLTQGRLVLEGREFNAGGFHPVRNDGLSLREKALSDGWPTLSPFRTLRASSYGSQQFHELSSIAAAAGSSSLENLIWRRLRFKVGSQYLLLLAPVLARLETTVDYQRGRLQATVSFHPEINSGVASLSVEHRFFDSVAANAGNGEQAVAPSYGPANGFIDCRLSLNVPDGAVGCDLALYHQGYADAAEAIANAEVDLPAALSTSQPARDALFSVAETTWHSAPRDWLRVRLGVVPGQTPKNPDHFEEGVSALFFAAGLPTMPIPMARGVDQIVTVPNHPSVVVLVSCTLGTDLPKKLANLRPQRTALRERFPDLDVVAVVALPTRRVDLAIDYTELQRDGVVLLCHEDLRVLVDGLDQFEGEEFRTQVLRRLLPPESARMILDEPEGFVF